MKETQTVLRLVWQNPGQQAPERKLVLSEDSGVKERRRTGPSRATDLQWGLGMVLCRKEARAKATPVFLCDPELCLRAWPGAPWRRKGPAWWAWAWL